MNNATETFNKAFNQLSKRLLPANFNDLPISDYNKSYLKRYQDNFRFYMSQYSQLLSKIQKKLNKPIGDSIFVDYGGGTGMLSYIAKLIGFKEVIYVDLFHQNVEDIKIISQELGIKIDLFIHGDIDDFIKGITSNNKTFDVIASFDVLEHIYDLQYWFKQLAELDHSFILLFQTGANPKNPYINYKLKKHHKKEELQGYHFSKDWKECDSPKPYLLIREEIIQEHSPELSINENKFFAKNTRGLIKSDIEKVVSEYKQTGELKYSPKHSTNTCDPNSGSWSEKLIDLNDLRSYLKSLNFQAQFTNTYYGYSENRVFNIPKYALNMLIKTLKPRHLYLSPAYTLEVFKQSQKTDL